MKTITFEHVLVTAPDEAKDEELHEYVKLYKPKYPKMQSMNVELDGEYVNLAIVTKYQPFERLRRITGYLVGTMDRWNNGKRAEERDRVKHDV